MKLGTVRQTVLREQMGVHILCDILYKGSEIKILLSVCEFYIKIGAGGGGHTPLAGVNRITLTRVP